MRRLGLATALLLVCMLPAEGQQVSELAPTLGISPADPAMSGLILDTVAPLPPLRIKGLTTTRPLTPELELTAPMSGLGYDRLSGSVYRWTQSPSGGTRLRGIIPGAGGSSWSGSISASGTLSGFDGNLDPFRYDPRTGARMNTVTGESCVGQGLAGPCR